MNALKVRPRSALIGWPSSSIGPQSQSRDVLQEHQARPGGVRPANHHPGQPANPAVTRRAALGLAVMPAIRRGPENANRLAAGGMDRIRLEYVHNVVRRLRVVGAVNRQGDNRPIEALDVCLLSPYVIGIHGGF